MEEKLKTLKDFGKDGSSWLIYVGKGSVSLSGKDGEDRREVFPLESLRQEAIKWIKELRKHQTLGKPEKPTPPEIYISIMNTSNWIAYFFNITEKELK